MTVGESVQAIQSQSVEDTVKRRAEVVNDLLTKGSYSEALEEAYGLQQFIQSQQHPLDEGLLRHLHSVQQAIAKLELTERNRVFNGRFGTRSWLIRIGTLLFLVGAVMTISFVAMMNATTSTGVAAMRSSGSGAMIDSLDAVRQAVVNVGVVNQRQSGVLVGLGISITGLLCLLAGLIMDVDSWRFSGGGGGPA